MSTEHRRRRAVRLLTDAGGDAAATLNYIVISSAGDATTVAEGDTLQLTATAKDISGTTLTPVTFAWSSSDEDVMTVDSSGLVTVAPNVFAGSAVITAAVDWISATFTLTVTADNVPAAVAVTPTTASIASAATQQFAAAVTNAEGRTLTGVAGTWSSDDTNVATINASGLATGVSAGTANINFTTTQGSVSDGSPAVLTVS